MNNSGSTKRKAAGGSQIEQQPDQHIALLQDLLVTMQKIDETTQAIQASVQEIATDLRTVICEKQEEQAPTTKQEQRDRESGKEAAPSPSFYRGQWVGVEPQPIILRGRRARQGLQSQPEEEEVHS